MTRYRYELCFDDRPPVQIKFFIIGMHLITTVCFICQWRSWETVEDDMTVLSDDYDKMIKLPCCGSALWGYASAGYPQGRSCCTAGTQPTRRVLKNKKTRKKTSCQNSPKSYFLKNNAYHLFHRNINTVDWLVASFYLQQFKTDWWIGCKLFYLQTIQD